MPLLDRVPDLRQPAPGVDLVCLPDERFKRAQVLFHFDRPLDGDSPARTLLCRMLEQGTAAEPTRMHFSRALERLYGASLEIDGDRVAEMHRVSLCMSWVGERFLPPDSSVQDGALALARSLMEDPVRGSHGDPFPGESLNRERNQLIRQIRSLADDRAAYAQERFLAEICQGEPYGRPPWGDEAAVAELGGEDLERVRVGMLAIAPVTVFAVGPLDPDAVELFLAEWFGSSGPHAGAQRAQPPPPVRRVPGGLRTVREPFEVDQARFHLGFRFPPPAAPEEVEALSLANAVLGAGTSSRLFRVVREERSLAYGIYSVLRTAKGLLVVEAGIDASAFEGLRDEVLRQVEALAGGAVAEEDLHMARAGMLNDLNAVGDSASSLANFFARERLLGFHRTPAERAAQLAAITREDVAATAARWLPDLVYLLEPASGPAEAA